MIMLRWISGVSKIRNKYVSGRLGVANIVEKIKENRLRWFGCVKKRNNTNIVQRINEINVKGNRARGRPMKKWKEVLRNIFGHVNKYDQDVEGKRYE